MGLRPLPSVWVDGRDLSLLSCISAARVQEVPKGRGGVIQHRSEAGQCAISARCVRDPEVNAANGLVLIRMVPAARTPKLYSRHPGA